MRRSHPLHPLTPPPFFPAESSSSSILSLSWLLLLCFFRAFLLRSRRVVRVCIDPEWKSPETHAAPESRRPFALSPLAVLHFSRFSSVARFQCFSPLLRLVADSPAYSAKWRGPSARCSFGFVDWMVRPARMNESMRNFWINRGHAAAPFDSKPREVFVFEFASSLSSSVGGSRVILAA